MRIEQRFLQGDIFSNVSREEELIFGMRGKEDGEGQKKSSFGLRWFKENAREPLCLCFFLWGITGGFLKDRNISPPGALQMALDALKEQG
jgi:hypothetical protein